MFNLAFITLSIDVISCGPWVGSRLLDGAKRIVVETHLDQNISHVLEPTLSAVSPVIPVPVFEQVVVYHFVVYQDVLCEFGRIIVEKVAECFDNLSDNSSETGVMFRQFFRERDQRIKRPCLLSL